MKPKMVLVLENKVLQKSEKLQKIRQSALRKNVTKISNVKKCLFGTPNRSDTQKFLNEELEKNRTRFIERFDFDILNDLENNSEILSPCWKNSDHSGPHFHRYFKLPDFSTFCKGLQCDSSKENLE